MKKATEMESTGLTCPHPRPSSAGASCRPQTFKQAGKPQVEPYHHPPSGAGALWTHRKWARTLLQNGLQLWNTESSLCKAFGDHLQSMEGSCFSLHKGSFTPGAWFILWDHTPTPLLWCNLLIIIIQLEFVSFKHRRVEHPLPRALVSQSLLPGPCSPARVWGERPPFLQAMLPEAMALPLCRAGWPPPEGTHWAQCTWGTFWFCQR